MENTVSKDEIASRIRLMFYSIFGVIFAFLFIATSSYLQITEQASIKQSSLIINNLVEGLKVREKLIYEEFATSNDDSIRSRISLFLNTQLIESFNVQVIRDNFCVTKKDILCDLPKKFDLKSIKKISSFTILGSVYIIIPMQGWGENIGFVAVNFPQSEVSALPNLFQKITWYVLPFIFLTILILGFYFVAERRIIKPTIKRIIESEKIKAQQAIVRQFAHDIKSPVSALESVLSVEMLSSRLSNEVVKEALLRINSISSELLDWDRSHLRLEDVDVRKLLSSIIEEKKHQFNGRNLDIMFHVDDLIRTININSLDFYRTISNLINNSIESAAGNICIVIKVETFLDGVKIIVSDNGPGIHSEKLSLILDGKYSSKSNGNGLGLSSAKLWAEKLNGLLSINSQIGLGTTIEISLPISAS